MCTLVTLQYIPRNMHTVFALLCFVVVIHWLIFPYPSGLLHWHCGNLTIAPVPAKQPWWIWINTSREFIMNDCITTTKQSTTKPCAYFLGYTVYVGISCFHEDIFHYFTNIHEACFTDIVVKSIFPRFHIFITLVREHELKKCHFETSTIHMDITLVMPMTERTNISINLYNAVNFPENIQKRHPIARPIGWVIGCVFYP